MGNASGAQVEYGQIKSALKTTVIGLSQGRVQSTFVVPDNLGFQVNNKEVSHATVTLQAPTGHSGGPRATTVPT